MLLLVANSTLDSGCKFIALLNLLRKYSCVTGVLNYWEKYGLNIVILNTLGFQTILVSLSPAPYPPKKQNSDGGFLRAYNYIY